MEPDFSDPNRCPYCHKTREEAEREGGCIMCLLSPEQRAAAERLHNELKEDK